MITETGTGSPSQKVARATLPIPLTSFVGREQEIVQIMQLLGTSRLVTLTGAGGSGKTRLALQTATLLSGAEHYADGVGWVELSSLLNPELVPQTVAVTLGIREVPNEPRTETLAQYLRSRKFLLVFDNCEHLITACARLGEYLLGSCPHLKILATSREALAIGAEHLWPVSPLSFPRFTNTGVDPNSTEFEAIQLFVERARTVNPRFELSQTNAPAVQQICERLDGIPLAIELASARVKVLTVEQIAARLEDRFDLLSTASPTALPRHQTLRATMDWSYELLSSQEQTFFRRLSVFAGGWTLEAAEAVCSGEDIEPPQVLDLLSRMVDKSLVTAQEKRGAARYYLLETIRVYAHEKLQAANELQVVQGRHLDFFLRLAEDTKSRVPLWFYQERMLKETFSEELDNFRAALAWSLDGAEVEKGVELAANLFWFWNISSFTSEGNEWLRRALATGNRVSPVVRAKALLVSIYTHSHRGEYDEAITFGNECVYLCRELADAPLLADALRALARAFSNQGNQVRAAETVEESIEICRELGRESAVVDCLTILAATRQLQNDAKGSVPILEESLMLARKLNDTDGIYLSLGMLGRAELKRGNYAQAALLYNQYMAFNWKMGWVFRLAYGLEFHAILATLQQQPERAARLWGAAHELRKVSGVPRPRMHERDHTTYEATARTQLDQQTYARFYAEGEAMPLEEAVQYALAEPIPPLAESSGRPLVSEERDRQRPGGLTVREKQIAQLVAKGKSNREIADELVLSLRTVENHVSHILARLGFHSRAQIAAWVVENDLLKKIS